MHDELMSHQDRLAEQDLRGGRRALGLDPADGRGRRRAGARARGLRRLHGGHRARACAGRPRSSSTATRFHGKVDAGAAARGRGGARVRTALVTGAGRGIGRGIALGLAQAGYAVALVGPDARAPGRRRGGDRRPDVCVAAADLIDATAVLDAVARVEEELGGIGLLVNNAGVIERAEVPFVEDDVEDSWRVIEANVRGPLLVTHAVLPGMLARGDGRVLNLNSGAGHRAMTELHRLRDQQGRARAVHHAARRAVPRPGDPRARPGPRARRDGDDHLDADARRPDRVDARRGRRRAGPGVRRRGARRAVGPVRARGHGHRRVAAGGDRRRSSPRTRARCASARTATRTRWPERDDRDRGGGGARPRGDRGRGDPRPHRDAPGPRPRPRRTPPTTPAPDTSVTPTETTPAEPVPTVTVTQEPPSPEPAPTETVVVEVPWTHEPAAATSTIPLGAVITALLVLVVATTALVLALRRNRGARPTGVIAAAALEPAASTTEIGILDDAHAVAIPAEAPADTVETVRFLMLLGEAMIDSSAPVVQVTRTLERVAAINGAPDVEVIALPTALLVSVPGRTTDADGRVVGGLATAAPAPGAGRARRGRRRRVRAGRPRRGCRADRDGRRRAPAVRRPDPRPRVRRRLRGPGHDPRRQPGRRAGRRGARRRDRVPAGRHRAAARRVPGAGGAELRVRRLRCGVPAVAHRDRRRDARAAGRAAGHVPAGRPAHHGGDRPGHPADDRGVGAPRGGRDAAGPAGARHRRRRGARGRPRVRGRLRDVPAARLGGAVDRRARLRHGRGVPQLRTPSRAALDPARARRRLRRAGGGRAVLRRGVLRVHRGAAHDPGRDVRRHPPDRSARAGRVPAGVLAPGARVRSAWSA